MCACVLGVSGMYCQWGMNRGDEFPWTALLPNDTELIEKPFTRGNSLSAKTRLGITAAKQSGAAPLLPPRASSGVTLTAEGLSLVCECLLDQLCCSWRQVALLLRPLQRLIDA